MDTEALRQEVILLLSPLIEDNITAGKLRSKADEVVQLIVNREAAAEDRVVAIANSIPCDCGSSDHFATPTRSVQGSITKYCQFSMVKPSAALNSTGKAEK